MPNYHDVTVYVDGVPYKPSRNYALQLVCAKASGWRLYSIWDGKERPLGGEFDGEPFCITVGDRVVCGEMPAQIKAPANVDGWDGTVWRERTNAELMEKVMAELCESQGDVAVAATKEEG